MGPIPYVSCMVTECVVKEFTETYEKKDPEKEKNGIKEIRVGIQVNEKQFEESQASASVNQERVKETTQNQERV